MPTCEVLATTRMLPMTVRMLPMTARMLTIPALEVLATARFMPTMARWKLTTARFAQSRHSETGPPPSLRELPPALWQLLVQTMPGGWGGGGSDVVRPLQSETGPPSSQSAS
jgi:hypothetical protein